jgi:hypothetical protein
MVRVSLLKPRAAQLEESLCGQDFNNGGNMKKIFALFILLAAVLVSCASLMGAQSLLSGTVSNPDGTGFNGRLIFSLAQAGSVSTFSPCVGPALDVPVETVSVVVTGGALVSPPTLTSSTCTIPVGIPYNVIAVDSNGNVAFTDQWIISGNPFNVGTAVSSGSAPTVSYKGLWNVLTTYNTGDIVAYGGSVSATYVSVVDNNIGNPPATSTAYWQQITGTLAGCGNPIGIPCGGTGTTTAAGALANLGALPAYNPAYTGHLTLGIPGNANGVHAYAQGEVQNGEYVPSCSPNTVWVSGTGVGNLPTPTIQTRLGRQYCVPNTTSHAGSDGCWVTQCTSNGTAQTCAWVQTVPTPATTFPFTETGTLNLTTPQISITDTGTSGTGEQIVSYTASSSAGNAYWQQMSASGTASFFKWNDGSVNIGTYFWGQNGLNWPHDMFLNAPTLATNGTNQASPYMKWCANGFSTTATASEPICLQGRITCPNTAQTPSCTLGFGLTQNANLSGTMGISFGTVPVAVSAIQQIAVSTIGGTCSMAATTSCTITIGTTYTTPVCIATQQSATLTGGAVGCTVSGTTVTITSAVANSETWGAFVFGNPK